MNEKSKAQALARARTLQPDESSEVKGFQAIIEENLAVEAQLYASRGYGGYIKTEHVEAIRADITEAVEAIERLRGR